jgi:hypothetical protein
VIIADRDPCIRGRAFRHIWGVGSSVIGAARGLLCRPGVSSHNLASLVLLGLGATIAIGCGGRESAQSPGAVDSGDPDVFSCPASFADIPQGTSGANASCPLEGACSYFNQFMCFCEQGSGWECTQANCICESGDAGCVSVACNSDAECPSGQHCAVGLGSPVRVCSVGCEDGGVCPSGTTCKTFAP